MTIVNINGNTYDTNDLIVDRGYITMFPAMLNDAAAVGQLCQDALNDQLAALAGEQITTSTTSRTIASGTLTFTTADNLDTDVILPDQCNVKIYSAGDITKYMFATVTSAVGTALTVSVYSTNGSGTFADWVIFREGRAGTTVLDIAGLSIITIDPAADHIPFRDVSGSANGKATPNAIVNLATVVEHDTCVINNVLTVTDYVIGYFDFTCTLTNVEMISSAGTGTVVLYLSPNRTAASGTAITGGSVNVSTTKATASLTSNNTVTSGTSRYLIAQCTASSSLADVVVALRFTKTGGA